MQLNTDLINKSCNVLIFLRTDILANSPTNNKFQPTIETLQVDYHVAELNHETRIPIQVESSNSERIGILLKNSYHFPSVWFWSKSENEKLINATSHFCCLNLWTDHKTRLFYFNEEVNRVLTMEKQETKPQTKVSSLKRMVESVIFRRSKIIGA